jgi:hypothetical protein
MKTFLTIILLLSSMIIFQNDVQAVKGVADGVPANSLVFPFICERGEFGGLNTFWAIAETKGLEGEPGPFRAYLKLYDKDGILRYDDGLEFTGSDVVSGECQGIVRSMPVSERSFLATTIGGTDYWAGYIIVEGLDGVDRFVGWTTLYDYSNGSAAGFKPFHAEGGVDDDFLAELVDTGLRNVQ